MWELAHGPIPPGMCVLHTCDTPACVEIGHLWLGTHHDNALDRSQKGRSGKSKRGLPWGVNRLAGHRTKPYTAQARINGMTRYFGYFATAGEAHLAARQAVTAHRNLS
jgi:hypothetical protein